MRTIIKLVSSALGEYRPLLAALQKRMEALYGMRSRSAREGFAERFDEIDLAFSSASTSHGLVSGWARFRSQLVRTGDGLWGGSIPAADAFERLDEPARTLEWWANIVVAIGLVITFLGIVAALTEATSSIGAAGATSSAAQASLLGLLTIAATKFWTSIAGFLSSIVLRIAARRRRRRLQQMEEDLFAALDSCIELLTPERLLSEQLQLLHRIEAALEPRRGAAA